MLMTKERRPAIRALRGWAISVLQEAGAIKECEEHGWMQDRADPHARERALELGRQEAPRSLSQAEAVAEVRDEFDRRHVPGVPLRGRLDSLFSPQCSRPSGTRRRVSSIHASAALSISAVRLHRLRRRASSPQTPRGRTRRPWPEI